jgi:hypothetical protein
MDVATWKEGLRRARPPLGYYMFYGDQLAVLIPPHPLWHSCVLLFRSEMQELGITDFEGLNTEISARVVLSFTWDWAVRIFHAMMFVMALLWVRSW